MSMNATVETSPTNVTQSNLFGEELALTLRLVFTYVLYPCTSVFGIVGNVTSILILTRDGFKKCSNILLLALAVSDVLYLTGINRFPAYLYSNVLSYGFRFSANINYMLYIMNVILLCFYYIGNYLAMVIPVLITGERLLAIFCPLKVYFIITPTRTVLSLMCIFIILFIYVLYRYILGSVFINEIINGVVVGTMNTADFIDTNSELVYAIDSTIDYFTGIIPIILVIFGSIVIGIQVGIISNRRKHLFSRQKSAGVTKRTSKTTKTLLSICVLYIACNGCSFAFNYIVFYENDDKYIWFGKFLTYFKNWLFSINCFGDSIIYILANSKFRNTISLGRKESRSV